MKPLLPTLALLAALISSSANAARIGLTSVNSVENTAQTDTLTAMKHTVTARIKNCLDLVVSAPGNYMPAVGSVSYLQISDWGRITSPIPGAATPRAHRRTSA